MVAHTTAGRGLIPGSLDTGSYKLSENIPLKMGRSVYLEWEGQGRRAVSQATSTNLGKPPPPLSQDVIDPDTCTESRSPSKSKSTSRNVVPTLLESKHCNKDPFQLCKNSFFSQQWTNRPSLPRVRKQREITGIGRILSRSGEKDLSLVNRTKCSSTQATPLLEHTNWLLNATEVRAPEGDPQGCPHTVQQSFPAPKPCFLTAENRLTLAPLPHRPSLSPHLIIRTFAEHFLVPGTHEVLAVCKGH